MLGFTLAAASPDDRRRAAAILKEHPIIDGHNDVPIKLRELGRDHLTDFAFDRLPEPDRAIFHTDLERLRRGGVGGQFWSVFVQPDLAKDEAVRKVFEQIDITKRLIDRYPSSMTAARSADDIGRSFRNGRIASLMGAEGGHSIGNSLAVLRQLSALGVGYMTLTHSKTIDWADSATDAPRHGGLTDFGEQVVREMNRLGMLVDLSHVSPDTMHDAIRVSRAPVIFSHSNAYAVTPHARNVPDDVLKLLPKNGGVVMVTFVPPFTSTDILQRDAAFRAEGERLKALFPGDPAKAKAALDEWAGRNPLPKATIAQLADHVDHIRKVAGIDHIGIGSDFDGIPTTIVGLGDASGFTDLFAELLRRGYGKQDLAKIANGNILRVMRQAERTAALAAAEAGSPAHHRKIGS